MNNCARCGTPEDDLHELARFASEGLTIEHVCKGCCTRVEEVLSRRIPDDPDLLALVLSTLDAIDRHNLRRAQAPNTVGVHG